MLFLQFWTTLSIFEHNLFALNLYNAGCGCGGINMNWIQDLTKAIQYIESNLTSDITVNDVANHMYASGTYYQH
jgi:hypothetical protein